MVKFTSDNIQDTVYQVVKYGVIVGLLVSFLVLFVGSVLVHDTHYITKNPKFFISETLIMGILTGLPVAYITYLRGGSHRQSFHDFGLFFFKIVLLHIGFQLSGVYSVIFPMTSNLEK